jgi:hypothetical protein
MRLKIAFVLVLLVVIVALTVFFVIGGSDNELSPVDGSGSESDVLPLITSERNDDLTLNSGNNDPDISITDDRYEDSTQNAGGSEEDSHVIGSTPDYAPSPNGEDNHGDPTVTSTPTVTADPSVTMAPKKDDNDPGTPIITGNPDIVQTTNSGYNDPAASTGSSDPDDNPAPNGGDANEEHSIITSERKDGPTPNGGDYSEIFYFDNDGNSVDKAVATRAIVRECKNDGTVVNEVYANLR